MLIAIFVLLLNIQLILGNKLSGDDFATNINQQDARHMLIKLVPHFTNLRYRRSAKDAGINLLRLYLCEADYRNCFNENRYT